jgi:monovalent cation/hydrogen antiporter
MRGVVSLTAALSVSLLLENDSPFPQRNLILFITFIVIFVTLVLQGLTFPFVIHMVNYRNPDHLLPPKEQDANIQMQLLRQRLAG